LDVEWFKGLEAQADARLLGVDGDGSTRRKLQWRDVVAKLTELPFSDWGVQGPRTTFWCCRFIDRRGGGPTDHHRWFLYTHGLSKDSWGVNVHESGLKILQLLGEYDHLDLPNSAGVEALLRQVQLIEYVYMQDSAASRGKGGGKTGEGKKEKSAGVSFTGFVDELAVFSGSHRETGEAMVCPALLQFVAAEVERDAGILKQVRKAREERAALAKKD